MTLVLRVFPTTDPMMVDSYHLSWFHIPDKLGSNHTESASLAADHITITQFANGQRPQPIFVPGCIKSVFGHYQEGKCTLDHIQGLYNRENPWTVPFKWLFLDKMGQYLTIRCGLEKAAPILQIFTQLIGIHQIAIMCPCKIPGIVPE